MDNCKKCSLSAKTPGVTIDSSGLCNHCRSFVPPSPEETFKFRSNLEKELALAAGQLRGQKHKYHCIVALSGGKDSSYTAWLMAKKYKLNVLAITVDIGYLQEQAYHNISSLTKKLGIDHIFIKEESLFNSVYKHGFSGKFFSKEEGLACSICCKLIPNVILTYAMEHNIPWIALGHFRLKEPKLFLDTKKFILSLEKFDPVMSRLFSSNKSLCTQANAPSPEKELPAILNPMNTLVDYSAKKVYEDLETHTGIAKEGFYSEKTTCLVSMATMTFYKKARGYNPYAADVCTQIRNGIIDKDDAGIQHGLTDMVDLPENKKLVTKVLKSIGVIS